jgi:hypothetical protein
VFGLSGWEKAVSELKEEITRLKRLVEERDLDWVDMRSRCKRLLDRTEKAATRVAAGEVVLPSDQPVPNGEGTVAASGRVLSAHQLEIQQKILRRRSGV